MNTMEAVGSYIVNLTESIGQGSYAIVYKGYHNNKNSRQVVAVKKILKKRLSLFPHTLQKEISILRELTTVRHRNIVSLYDCKETPENVYVILEYCNGGDLQQYIRGHAPLKEELVTYFLRQIAAAMMVLHMKGIVHRDLKPQNILICRDQERKADPFCFILKIADFGFARFLGDGLMTETQCGSPIYMAPEIHLSNKYDGRADLFSVGVIIFELLTMRHPFYAPTRERLARIYHDNKNAQPRYPTELSPDMRDLLQGLLATDPDERLSHHDFFEYFVRGADEVATKRRRQDSVPLLEQDLPSLPAEVTPHRPFTPAKTFPVIKKPKESGLNAISGLNEISEPQMPRIIKKPKESGLNAISQPETPRIIEMPRRPVSPSLDDFVVISKDDIPDEADDADMQSSKTTSSPLRPLTQETGPLTPSAPVSIPLRARMFQHLYQKPLSSPESNGDHQMAATPRDFSPLSSKVSASSASSPVFPRQSSLASMPSVESLCTPTVQFVVGTPNSDSSNSPTVLTPVSSISPIYRQGSQLNLPLHMRFGSANNSIVRFSDSSSSVGSPSSPPPSLFFPDVSSSSSFPLSAPVMTEKALLEKSDLDVINKFEFVFELCTCIRSLARARDSSLSESLVLGRALPCHSSMVTNEKQRRVEQFQLYVYALNLLSSSINLAQDLIGDGKVKSSQTLKEVVTNVNDLYKCCLIECHSIRQNYAAVLRSKSIPNPPSKTLQRTEQLLYNCAVDLCRSAWADQICGNLQGCCHSYNSAHLLLHAVGRQVTHDDKRLLLEHCQDAVEKELLKLSNKGFVILKD